MEDGTNTVQRRSYRHVEIGTGDSKQTICIAVTILLTTTEEEPTALVTGSEVIITTCTDQVETSLDKDLVIIGRTGSPKTSPATRTQPGRREWDACEYSIV